MLQAPKVTFPGIEAQLPGSSSAKTTPQGPADLARSHALHTHWQCKKGEGFVLRTKSDPTLEASKLGYIIVQHANDGASAKN